MLIYSIVYLDGRWRLVLDGQPLAMTYNTQEAALSVATRKANYLRYMGVKVAIELGESPTAPLQDSHTRPT